MQNTVLVVCPRAKELQCDVKTKCNHARPHIKINECNFECDFFGHRTNNTKCVMEV